MFTSRAKRNPTHLHTTDLILRCAPAFAILALGVLALAVIQSTELTITGVPSYDFRAIVGLSELGAYVWLRRYATVPFTCQLIGLGAIVTVHLACFAAIRIDGYMGDGRPRVAWRWSPRHPDVRPIQPSAAPAEQHGDAPADLSQTSPYDSPGFRGVDRSGAFQASGPDELGRTMPQLIWRRPVGLGWSSFAVVGNYGVTQEQRGDLEAVTCYDANSGREVWVHYDQVRFHEVTSGTGPRATPTIHQGKVYALGATGILNCLDGRDGSLVWSVNILENHPDDKRSDNALFGMTGSPLIWQDLVVVAPGGAGRSLVAYDAQSGKSIWSAGDARTSYASPQFAPFDPPQILHFNADGLTAHDARTGLQLWQYPWISNPWERNNVCQPVPMVDLQPNSSHVLLASGYGRGATLLELHTDQQVITAVPCWENQQLKPKFSSVVRDGDYVYGLDDKILVCLHLPSGKRQWKGGRYGYGQLALVNHTLVVQAESGEVAFVEANPHRHVERLRFPALADRTWNHPVVCGDRLFVRNDQEAACYHLGPTPQHNSERDGDHDQRDGDRYP